LYFQAPCTDCNVTGFRVSSDGALSPIANSTRSIDYTPVRVPIELKFAPSGDVLISALFQARAVAHGQVGKELVSYHVDRKSGLLSEAPGSPISDLNGPIEFVFNPVNPTQMWIAGEHMDSYLVAETGQIAKIGPLQGTNNPDIGGTCWVVSAADGKHIYATATFNDRLAVYSTDTAGNALETQVVAVPADTRPIKSDLIPIFGDINAPVDMALTGDGKFVYTVQTLKPTIGIFKVASGGASVAPAGEVVLPYDTFPYGMAIVEDLD
jgi:6-phosphogluconolactonase